MHTRKGKGQIWQETRAYVLSGWLSGTRSGRRKTRKRKRERKNNHVRRKMPEKWNDGAVDKLVSGQIT